jgi:nucleotide-binding universal stress UspA family protein
VAVGPRGISVALARALAAALRAVGASGARFLESELLLFSDAAGALARVPRDDA